MLGHIKVCLDELLPKFLLDWAVPLPFLPPCGCISLGSPWACPSASGQAGKQLQACGHLMAARSVCWLCLVNQGHNAACQYQLLCFFGVQHQT